MRKLAISFTIFLLSLLLPACSSVDSDARKAAELNLQSLNYIKNRDLKKAEELYKESQEIVARYKGKEQYKEFQNAYSNYMLENASKN